MRPATRHNDAKPQPPDTGSEASSVLVARTALISTFSWEDPHTEISTWEDLLLRRKIPDKHGGESIALWEANESLPMEVAELAPQFQKRLPSDTQPSGHDADVWQSRGLKLTAEAKRLLFSSAKLWAGQGPEARALGAHHATKRGSMMVCDLAVTDVQVVLQPLGTGLLVLEVDWLPPNPLGTLDVVSCMGELQTWLFLSRLRHRAENVLEGWTFPNPEATIATTRLDAPEEDDDAERTCGEENSRKQSQKGKEKNWNWNSSDANVDGGLAALSEDDEDQQQQQLQNRQLKKQRKKEKRRKKEQKRAESRHLRSLGRMAGAVYGEEPITLEALGNWLVHLSNESSANPPTRINCKQRCRHHSTIVLNGAPSQQALGEHLFRLGRGLGRQRNRPPPPAKRMGIEDQDRVLVHWMNCYIGPSQEGTVCIGWPSTEEEKLHHFDVEMWPKLFQGIYLVLAMQALAESAVLSELGKLSAGQAHVLRMAASFDEMEQCRIRLRELVAMTARFMLSLSSADCGGCSEYAQFFSCMRQMLGTPSVKQEIRDQIKDLQRIVESQYMEEHKKLKRREMAEQMEQMLRRKLELQASDTKRHWYRVGVAAVPAVGLPALVVTSLFGMNIANTPSYDWWNLIGGLAGVTGLLVIIVVVVCAFTYVNGAKAKKAIMELPSKSTQLARRSMDLNSWRRSSHGSRPSEESHVRATSDDIRRITYEEGRHHSFSIDGVRRKSMLLVWEAEWH